MMNHSSQRARTRAAADPERAVGGAESGIVEEGGAYASACN
jgi:hypothetical protein